VKFAPIAVHYSTPYCHFQNNAENYIKDFKKTFVKILNDPKHPHSNEDWPLLLPTVTQALNLKIILSLGLSRVSLHYNRQSEFFPLAHLADADSTDLDSVFYSLALNVYDHIKKQRDKRLKSKRGIVPVYQPNQIVFFVDQTPSPPGVSSVLKTPNTGPYRIDCIQEKNVSLTELQTGKQVHSHIELIRPVSLKEFKLILANQWYLHSQYTKSAQAMPTRSSFLAAHPLDKNAVIRAENTPEEIEDEIDLPAFFVELEQGKQRILDPEPQHVTTPTPDPNPHLHADPALTMELPNLAAITSDMETYDFADPVSDPPPHEDADPDPGLEPHYVTDPDSESPAQAKSSHHHQGDIEDEILQFNSFRIHEDVSNSYKEKLKQPAP
jgi:hypothetical protein